MAKVAFHQPPLDEGEADSVRKSAEHLLRHTKDGSPVILAGSGTFNIPAGALSKRESSSGRRSDTGQTDGLVEIPATMVKFFADILKVMAAGYGVTAIRQDAELTTVQAAEILKVSRPFLVKCLEDGEIPHRKVGSHRRIRLDDVLAYKEAIDGKRRAVLDELVADAQEHNMGYDR